jgi:hypothetical protein
MLNEKELVAKYGTPGDPARLTYITLPYPMRIAWLPAQAVTKISCNKGIAKPLLAVFNDLLAHYGFKKIQELGIDLFSGCVNVRPKRGMEGKYAATKDLKYLSRHAWGTAIDLDHNRNGLKTKAPIAQFSKPEYKAMNDIFYKHGFIGYGRERGNDWMHFEINS